MAKSIIIKGARVNNLKKTQTAIIFLNYLPSTIFLNSSDGAEITAAINTSQN